MKKIIKLVAKQSAEQAKKIIRATMKSSPAEVKLTLTGSILGLVGGLYIGGAIGITGFFGAFGVPIAVLGFFGGSILGNRIGIKQDKNQLDKLLQKRDEILSALLAERNEKKITPITTNKEHREILFKAIDNANKDLVILSGWATAYVVDKLFQDRLEACLNRGTNVYIGYGYQPAHEPRQKKDQEQAEKNLSAILEWCEKRKPKGNLVYRYYPNHAKLLICDEKFAVNGGFNWLSNPGKSLDEERSWVVYDKEFISTELVIVINGIMSPLKSTKRDLLKKLFPWSD